MALANLLFKNTLYSFISFALRFLFNTLIIIKIARVVGVENFGVFTFSQSFAGIFSILADLGVSTYITRELANKNNLVVNNFTSIIFFKIILSSITFLIVFFTVRIFKYNDISSLCIQYLIVAVMINNFTELYNGVYRGLEKLEYETLITGFNSFVLFLLVFLTLFIKSDVVLITQSYLISRLIALGLTIILSRHVKFLYSNMQIDLRVIRTILIGAFPYGIHILFGVIYFQIDTVMLESMRGNYEVGIYQAAIKIIIIGCVFSAIIQNSFLPTISRLFSESFNYMIQVSIKMNIYLLTIGFALGVFVFMSSEKIILLVYGNEYLIANKVLKLLSLLIILRFASTSFGVILTACGKQKLRMYSTIIAAIVNISLNFFFITKFGYFGAAIATVLTNILLLVLYFIFVYKFTNRFFINSKLLNIIPLILMLGFMNFFLKDQNIYLIGFVFLLSFLVYFHFFIFDNEERVVIYQFIRKVIKR